MIPSFFIRNCRLTATTLLLTPRSFTRSSEARAMPARALVAAGDMPVDRAADRAVSRQWNCHLPADWQRWGAIPPCERRV
jgi:hypothetical protein